MALDNDLRLREMAALREAAEADKRSLLTRLGRKTLGDTIVGVESGLRAVMERVELVARTDAPVLIFGETGTGKELVARAIHNRSSRHNGPFDRVNCGAIPPELIDSQLFGHERGAFTGAVEARRGWFERADGGTLFLDEIGELPPAAQVRMLRILQDGWMERVGAREADQRRRADRRRHAPRSGLDGGRRAVSARTCGIGSPCFRSCCRRCASGARTSPSWPPHFAERAATRFGLAPVAPTPEDLALLTSYSWPGNVRELAAVIDRAAILGDGKAARRGHGVGRRRRCVAQGLDRRRLRTLAAAVRRPAQPKLLPTATIEPLDAAMRRHIEAALAVAHGRIEGRQGAAAMLQINPHTLRAKMRKLGIDWARFRNAG